MADEADFSDVRQQYLLDASISVIRDRARVSIEGNGVCIECGDMVKPVIVANRPIIGRFCCVECRDAWERGK